MPALNYLNYATKISCNLALGYAAVTIKAMLVQ